MRITGVIIYSVTIICFGCFLIGGCGAEGQSPIIVDLKVEGYVEPGVPLITKNRQQLLMFWRGRAVTRASRTGGIPQFTDSVLKGSRIDGPVTVTYVSELANGQWNPPVMLGRCDPHYAWTDGRGLNILIKLGDGSSSHLLLPNGANGWELVQEFPQLKESVFVPLGIKQVANDLHVTAFSSSKKEICYWHYSHGEWRHHLVIEDKVDFDGTFGYFEPRLTVDDLGLAHIIWNTQSDPCHVTVSKGKVISKSSILLTPPVAAGNALDVESLDNGRLILSYRANHESGAVRDDCVYMSDYVAGQWGQVYQVGAGLGEHLGTPQLAAYKGNILLAWMHKAEESDPLGLSISSPAISFITRDGNGIWGAAISLACDPPKFLLFCDSSGVVHMGWADDSLYYVRLGSL